jgi:hypothetical protein
VKFGAVTATVFVLVVHINFYSWLPNLFSDLNEIGIEYLQRVLSCIYEFRENQHKEGLSVHMGENKIIFFSVQRTHWHLESRDRLSKFTYQIAGYFIARCVFICFISVTRCEIFLKSLIFCKHYSRKLVSRPWQWRRHGLHQLRKGFSGKGDGIDCFHSFCVVF